MSGHMFRHRDSRPGEEPEATKKADGGDGGFGAFFSSHTWEGSKDRMRSALTRAAEASSAAKARAREASGALSEQIRANPTMVRLQRHPTLGRFFPAPAVHPETGELSPVEFLDSPNGNKGRGGDGADVGEAGSEETKNESPEKSDRKPTDLYSDSDEEDEDDIYAEDDKEVELPPAVPGSFAFWVEKAHTICPLCINIFIYSCLTERDLRNCCRPTTKFVDNGKVIVGRDLPGQSQKDYERLCKLEIDDDVINQLYGVFAEMDKRRSGGVTIDDFFDHFGFSEGAFSRRIFGMLDRDASGEIDFKEFVLTVWNVCTLNRNGLALFCFFLFDENNSGFLEPEEVEALVTAAYGVTTGHEERVRRVMKTIDPDGTQAVTKGDFLKYNNVNPLLLYPAYQFQAQLQVKILGKKWWHNIANVRTERFRANNIFEILDLFNTDPEFKKWVIYEDLTRPVRKENLNEHPLRNLESHSAGGHHPHPEHWRHVHNAWN